MSEANKRYYWLKLHEDFFRQKEIKQLRKIAGGDTFTIIYLKMLLRSLKDDGRLYYEGIDDDFTSEIALDIDEDEENVKVTVAFLLSKGILVQCKPDEYELLTAKAMTGSEGYAAQRMRKLRASKAEKLLEASHCDAAVTERDAAVMPSDEEIDIELESDTENSKSQSNTVQRKRFTPPMADEVKAYAKEKGYVGFNADEFMAFYESNGWMVGRNHMKDWKATVRYWMSRRNGQKGGVAGAAHSRDTGETPKRLFSGEIIV